MFCPGTATLGDGRVMISGGSSSDEVTFYDSKSNTWSKGHKMKIPRGYHSMTVLVSFATIPRNLKRVQSF